MDFTGRLFELSKAAGTELSEEQCGQFYQYYSMLVEKNKVMNLTAIVEEEDVIKKHFLDSISIVKAIPEVSFSSLIDIGTGAGFPGLPIKLACPDANVVLLDSLQKRVSFLLEVCFELGLKGIEAFHGRAEEFSRKPEYREQFDFAVSRAVARLPVLLEYALPFVKVGGTFVAYKSVQSDAEIKEAASAIKKLGGKLEDLVDISIPNLEADRKLILVRKISNCSKIYPRISGKITKEPL